MTCQRSKILVIDILFLILSYIWFPDIHSMARANLKKSVWLVTNTTTAPNLRGPESASIKIPLSDPNLLSKSTYFMKWGLKGGLSIDADSGLPRYVCTLMLWWYLSPARHFFSDWLLPYCEGAQTKFLVLPCQPFVILKPFGLNWFSFFFSGFEIVSSHHRQFRQWKSFSSDSSFAFYHCPWVYCPSLITL